MRLGIVVRDKDGNIKIDNPNRIKKYKRALKDSDWDHLHAKFGDEWIDKVNKKVRK